MTREDVIKSLETAVKNFERYSGDEYGREYDYARVGVDVLEDALALLKAQEPRVMSLEEVRDEAEYMFLEKHSKTGSDLYGCAIRGDCDGYGIELLISEYDCARGRWSDYGKTWRCWTSRPTDEQRRVTPWEQ